MNYSSDLVHEYLYWLQGKSNKDNIVKKFFKAYNLPYTHSNAVTFGRSVELTTGYKICEVRREYHNKYKSKEEYIATHGVTHYSNERWFHPAQLIRNLEQLLGNVRCYY